MYSKHLFIICQLEDSFINKSVTKKTSLIYSASAADFPCFSYHWLRALFKGVPLLAIIDLK